MYNNLSGWCLVIDNHATAAVSRVWFRVKLQEWVNITTTAVRKSHGAIEGSQTIDTSGTCTELAELFYDSEGRGGQIGFAAVLQRCMGVHLHGQVADNLQEGIPRLHDHSQINRSSKVPWRHDSYWHYPCEVLVERREHLQISFRSYNVPPCV